MSPAQHDGRRLPGPPVSHLPLIPSVHPGTHTRDLVRSLARGPAHPAAVARPSSTTQQGLRTSTEGTGGHGLERASERRALRHRAWPTRPAGGAGPIGENRGTGAAVCCAGTRSPGPILPRAGGPAVAGETCTPVQGEDERSFRAQPSAYGRADALVPSAGVDPRPRRSPLPWMIELLSLVGPGLGPRSCPLSFQGVPGIRGKSWTGAAEDVQRGEAVAHPPSAVTRLSSSSLPSGGHRTLKTDGNNGCKHPLSTHRGDLDQLALTMLLCGKVMF